MQRHIVLQHRLGDTDRVERGDGEESCDTLAFRHDCSTAAHCSLVTYTKSRE